jgi:predicted dehydrogenase
MKKLFVLVLVLFGTNAFAAPAGAAAAGPIKVGIVGLVHDHVYGFFAGGALAPAGGILRRPDVEVVGIVEPDQKLFDRYALRYHLAPGLHFGSIAEMVAHAHPVAALVFTAPSEHRRVVEECAALGVNVMMEKPLAFSYADALAMKRAAEKGKIHVLVDYETSWYASNSQAYAMVKSGGIGPVFRAVFRDGHEGPAKIGVSPGFLALLIDPKQDGDGALTDFGCYGPDQMTWMMHGEVPLSVSAVTRRLQPKLYPDVDDDAEIVLNYRKAVAVVEGSWDWPFALKQMDVYGRTGYVKTLDSSRVDVRIKDVLKGKLPGEVLPLAAPYDDPLHYLEAVMSGQIEEGDDLSGLKTNMTVTEILDAARQSAQTGRTVTLPLPQ